MKQFFKMFFASFLAIIISGIVLLGIFIAVIAGISKSVSGDNDESQSIEKQTVLVIDMEDEIHELGSQNPFGPLMGEPRVQAGLYSLLQAIKKAKDDDRVEGMIIKAGFSPNGHATLQQLRYALEDFKKSDKFVYAYGEIIPQKSYFLASIADSIFLNPAGFPELKGLSTQLAFFKGTLDKLEIQPEIFYAGKFKSATEPFRAEKISEPNRQQITAFQDDFWTEYLKAIAGHTKTDTATIQQLVQAGAIQFPQDAMRARLVDNLYYWDQVEKLMKQKMGMKEGDDDDDKINYTDLSDYASRANTSSSSGKRDGRIALVFAEGNIVDGESNEDYQIASYDLQETITKIRNNDEIKAVVLRVNSPGGSALASEVILRELQLLRQKKPLIVSMGDVAASGGYYIACAADSIFALPTTITGSIGVFSMLFNTEKLLNNKLGITMDEVKNAPYASFPTVTRPLTADESARMQGIVDTIYATFKRRVATGRRISEAMVDSIAQGRVWSGTDALGIGLVDGLGDLDRAIAAATKRANLKNPRVVTYPAPSDKFESVLRRMGGISGSTVLANAVKKELGADYELLRMFQELRAINGRAQMSLPFKLKIQ